MTISLPTGKFSVIYADPPWSFRSWSDKGRTVPGRAGAAERASRAAL